MSQTVTNPYETNIDDTNSEEISRNPEDYRPVGVHFFQSCHDRGLRKEVDTGAESWIITYLIKHGKLHHSKDENRYVFKGYIPDQTGTERRWWLPVEEKNGEANAIVTCPYVKGLKDIDIKLLEPEKPNELQNN